MPAKLHKKCPSRVHVQRRCGTCLVWLVGWLSHQHEQFTIQRIDGCSQLCHVHQMLSECVACDHGGINGVVCGFRLHDDGPTAELEWFESTSLGFGGVPSYWLGFFRRGGKGRHRDIRHHLQLREFGSHCAARSSMASGPLQQNSTEVSLEKTRGSFDLYIRVLLQLTPERFTSTLTKRTCSSQCRGALCPVRRLRGTLPSSSSCTTT